MLSYVYGKWLEDVVTERFCACMSSSLDMAVDIRSETGGDELLLQLESF